MAAPTSTKKIRVVVAKPGLDGHDRGAKIIARALRDAGMEVIYTGLHQTPEQIVETVLQEDADAVGLSILSGAHMTLVPKVIELLAEQDADDVVVTVGGTIPAQDIAELKELGVAEVFTPGAPDAGDHRLHPGRRHALVRGDARRPGQLDAGRRQLVLEGAQQRRIGAHRARERAPGGAERRQVAGRLAGAPLDRVQPVGAVGDVRRRDVLRARQQVVDPHRDQRAERDLERRAGDVDVGSPAGRGVQVDPVLADPDAVRRRRAAELLLEHRRARRGSAATRGCRAPWRARPGWSRRRRRAAAGPGARASVCSQWRKPRLSSRAAAAVARGVRHAEHRAAA